MTERAVFIAAELRGDGRIHDVVRDVSEPGPGELAIAPRIVGLCATDREVRDGEMVYFTTGMAAYPIVPGHEWVGTVVGIGPDVTGFAVGDRVVGECSIGCGHCAVCAAGRYHMCPDRHETGLIVQDGALAERLIFPARAAHVVPDAVPDEAAALIEPTAIAYNAVAVAGLQAHERVLIVGAGPIGLLAMQVARATGGAEVTVCDLSATRLRVAAELGADRTLHLGPDQPAPAAGGWDVVIEVSGSPGGMATALQAVRAEGRVVCVSLYGRATVPVDLDHVVTNDITLRGALGSPGRWPAVLELVARGAVTPAALVTTRVGFRDAATAFALVGDPGEVKIIVDLREGAS